MRIIFSEIAKITYENILDFLSVVWTEKEMSLFIEDTEKINALLKKREF